MGNVMNAPDLAGLIADAKGSRSYDQISRACGGKPTPERLHQLATQPIKNFPGPDTITALARGLDRSVTDVVAAASRSLGLDVQLGSDSLALTLPTAGTLPPQAQDALREVARQMLALQRSELDRRAGDERGHTPPMNAARVTELFPPDVPQDPPARAAARKRSKPLTE